MAEIKVQRYDAETGDYVRPYFEAADDGDAVLYADIAPLLAELADLRWRTWRRSVNERPPPKGKMVLGLTAAGQFIPMSRRTNGKCRDEHGQLHRFVAWWPLPEVKEQR